MREVLQERVASGPGPLRVDRQRGVIYGVKVLGERSANPPPRNNIYPRSTRERAAGLIEGARVYIDHPARNAAGDSRSYHDSLGVLRKVRESGHGLVADFHFNPKHSRSEQICWDAVNAPEHVGFSINAEAGSVRPEPSGRVVESIAHVHSVDLVSRPATTNGLFEARRRSTVYRIITRKQLLEALRRGGKHRQARLLEAAAEAAGIGDDMPMAEAPDGGAPDHEEALKQGFRAAVHAVVDDDTMDTAEKIRRMREILKAQEKLLAGDDEDDDDDDDEDEDEDEDLDTGGGSKRGPAADMPTTEARRGGGRQLAQTLLEGRGRKTPPADLKKFSTRLLRG
jgi:hypothetical protein